MKPGDEINRRPAEGARKNAGLHRFALLTATATWLLIIAGALVTSNEAGLAVPDWPLSYGQVFPPMVGNIRFEHSHRLIAATVGLLTIVLNIGLQRSEPRRWVRRVGLAALAAVLAQGLLGGMTVLFMLPIPVSVAHAFFAQVFFCLMVSLAIFTSPGWSQNSERTEGRSVEREADLHRLVQNSSGSRLRSLSVASIAILFLQLLLGAAFRHKGIGIIPHVLGAALATIVIGCAIVTTFRVHSAEKDLVRAALVCAGVLPLQLFLGVFAYLARLRSLGDPQPLEPMISLTVAHVAVGALILAATLGLALQAFRLMPLRGGSLNLSHSAQRAAL